MSTEAGDVQGDWKDLYQASVDGNLSLVEYHIREKVNPNY